MTQKINSPQFLRDLTARRLFAWEKLYNRYAACLYGIILRNVPPENADAVLMDTFVEMYGHIHEYDARRERFFTWMYRLTVRSCELAKKGSEDLQPYASFFVE